MQPMNGSLPASVIGQLGPQGRQEPVKLAVVDAALAPAPVAPLAPAGSLVFQLLDPLPRHQGARLGGMRVPI